MKRTRKIFWISLLYVLIFSFGASAKTVTMHRGHRASYRLPGRISSRVKWSSSNSTIVSVQRRSDNSCLFIAKKPGTCIIRAKYKGVTFKLTVNVLREDEEIISLLNTRVKRYNRSNRVCSWYRKGNYLVCKVGRPINGRYFCGTYLVNRKTGKVTGPYCRQLRIPRKFLLW